MVSYGSLQATHAWDAVFNILCERGNVSSDRVIHLRASPELAGLVC